MMASFVPKPVSINLPQGPNKGMAGGSVSEEQILTSTSYPTHPPGQQSAQQTSMYDNSPRGINTTEKKLNGNLVQPPSLAGNQQIQGQAQGRPPHAGNNVANSTGEPVSPEVLPGSGARGHPSGTGVNPSSGNFIKCHTKRFNSIIINENYSFLIRDEIIPMKQFSYSRWNANEPNSKPTSQQ